MYWKDPKHHTLYSTSLISSLELAVLLWTDDGSQNDIQLSIRCGDWFEGLSLIAWYSGFSIFFLLVISPSLDEESVDTMARLFMFAFCRTVFCRRAGPRFADTAASLFGVFLVNGEVNVFELDGLLWKFIFNQNCMLCTKVVKSTDLLTRDPSAALLVCWFFRGRPRFRPTSIDFERLLTLILAAFPESSSVLSLSVDFSVIVRRFRRIVVFFLFAHVSFFSLSEKLIHMHIIIHISEVFS